MAKNVRDNALGSRASREKLKASGKPYYRSLDAGLLHLGYRKGRHGGKWVMRRYLGNEKYEVETIAVADDRDDADGKDILTFNEAQAKAREIAKARRQEASGAAPITISTVLDAYLKQAEAQHSKSVSDSRNRIENHIRPAFGAMLASDLTQEAIQKWLKALADSPRNVRGKAGTVSRALAKPKTDDEKRRRRASANRTLTILRAALNQGFRSGKITSDTVWRTIQPFREVDAPRVRYFTQDEVRRLVNAAQGEFRSLVNAALFTGCRYGELCRLQVGDFNPDAGTVFVGQSKSGKARHVVLTEEGQGFFRQLTAGRPTNALMLSRADGAPWGASHQIRPMAEACKAAKIAKAGFHILRHTAASHNVMGGVPMPVVAKNLGHADSRMTEKHYAHLAPSYVADQIRQFAPTFGTVQQTNVALLHKSTKAN
ncbi:integrase family protein [Methylocella silvestris BL2]|uniref:Integrase family protein n=1 Tax=Methylocella silvestris (strain DSM 15510 / CIP 108128 / LMG 27833 / NCIMB 13906 / BL2) TaxID=395965 RepID=B8EKX9_METSB|nr:site-specific integrase [Methylocella silvestris]ACK52007.1 integrase family protein [Methylocella silvestris BL2]